MFMHFRSARAMELVLETAAGRQREPPKLANGALREPDDEPGP